MTHTRTVEVPSDALRRAVCMLDGLTRALDQVARAGRLGHDESARQDVTTLRKLRAELLPGRADDGAWRAETYNAASSWYTSIAFAFANGVPGRDLSFLRTFAASATGCLWLILSATPLNVTDMTSKRRNPKKNKDARRRRPDPPDLRRARLELEDIHRLMSAAPPAALPLVALTSVWLWNMSDRHAGAAHCVDGCLTLHHALAEYGIGSRVEAVGVRIKGSGADTVYGQNPRYNADGSFNGHTILVVTGADRLIDPTIQQFAEVPDSRRAMLPLQAPLPVPGGLGDQPVGINRGDHMVVYVPVPEQLRQAWRSPAIDARTADYQKAGTNLAANVVAMLQVEDMRDRAEQSPYPRLRRLLAALDGAEPVADSRGFRFADSAGKEIWLTDVP